MIEAIAYTLEVGDKIIQTHAFGQNIFIINKVTKTQAIHFNVNGYPIKFKRTCRLFSDGSAWVQSIPKVQWNTSTYKVIKNEDGII